MICLVGLGLCPKCGGSVGRGCDSGVKTDKGLQFNRLPVPHTVYMSGLRVEKGGTTIIANTIYLVGPGSQPNCQFCVYTKTRKKTLSFPDFCQKVCLCFAGGLCIYLSHSFHSLDEVNDVDDEDYVPDHLTQHQIERRFQQHYELARHPQ